MFIIAFVLFAVPTLLWFLLALKDLRSLAKLHRNGSRTVGTVVKVDHSVRGGSCTVRYTVGGTSYECTTDRVKDKWQLGTENIPILYDKDDPKLACFKTHDMISCVCFAVTGAILFFGTLIVAVMIWRLL